MSCSRARGDLELKPSRGGTFPHFLFATPALCGWENLWSQGCMSLGQPANLASVNQTLVGFSRLLSLTFIWPARSVTSCINVNTTQTHTNTSALKSLIEIYDKDRVKAKVQTQGSRLKQRSLQSLKMNFYFYFNIICSLRMKHESRLPAATHHFLSIIFSRELMCRHVWTHGGASAVTPEPPARLNYT